MVRMESMTGSFVQIVTLPELPSEEELQERDDMIKVLSSMNSVYQNSHFYISKENESNMDQLRMSLMGEIQVEGGYFPKELLQSSGRSRKGQRARQDVRSTPHVHPTTNIDLSLTRIEELARREGQSTAAVAGTGYVMPFEKNWHACMVYSNITHVEILVGVLILC